MEEAIELDDQEAIRDIMNERDDLDIFLTLPMFTMSKRECEVEIFYLDKSAHIDSSLCTTRDSIDLGNVMFLKNISVRGIEELHSR